MLTSGDASMLSAANLSENADVFNDDEVFEDRPVTNDDSKEIMPEIKYDESQYALDLGEVTLIKSKSQVLLQLRKFRMKSNYQRNLVEHNDVQSGTSPTILPTLFFQNPSPNTRTLCSLVIQHQPIFVF